MVYPTDLVIFNCHAFLTLLEIDAILSTRNEQSKTFLKMLIVANKFIINLVRL